MNWLKTKREEKNLTLSQVSNLTGISLSYLSQIESGKRKPSVNTAKIIAKHLNFDWTKFFK